jgi:hypothetical protein
MVIVVAILAVLAGIAVRGVDGLDQQARFDATQRVIRDINDAVLATGQDADGSLLVCGFVADMGRLPKAVVGSDGNLQLQELWSNSGNLQPFAVRPATQAVNPAITAPDPEVLIAGGWRGNYLRLGVGQSVLQDGWGNLFDLLKSDQATYVAVGDPIAAVRSRGANGKVDLPGTTSGYDADITISLGSAFSSADPCNVPVSGQVHSLDSNGNLIAPDPTKGDIVIVYFGPDPNTGLPAEQIVPIAAASFTGASGVSYSFVGTAGARVIRAYQGVGLAADPSSCATAPVKSVPVRLVLQPGGEVKDLVIR